MSDGNYYNEHDPQAAAWLRELIGRNLIAPGDVDERSIEDVCPNELAGYTQCHFFAGVGVWSYALRCAGWPDDRSVWTGSCPCQPFSAAGKASGFADERHLWPAFFHLIEQCRPVTVFGEQVASNDGLAWLDLVCADLEGAGYAVGAVDLCAAGVGAPELRQRLYFMAHAERIDRLDASAGARAEGKGGRTRRANGYDGSHAVEPRGTVGELADAATAGREGRTGRGSDGGRLVRGSDAPNGVDGVVGDAVRAERRADTEGRRDVIDGHDARREEAASRPELAGTPNELEYPDDTRPQGRRLPNATNGGVSGGERTARTTGAINGFWHSLEWVYCNDPDGPRWRPIRPGSFPLVGRTAAGVVRGGDIGAQVDEGTAEARTMRLKGYGNAIVAPLAEAFIRACAEKEVSNG